MRVLIAECMQEISSFNPLPSQRTDFRVVLGKELFKRRGLNTEIGGALRVFDGIADVQVVPVISARADSAGILAQDGWRTLLDELLDALVLHLDDADAIYFAMHGAMGAVGEPDPEGAILEALRGKCGPKVAIVVSLDLHGILTDRMLRQIDGVVAYRTYPHVDFADTGARAAELLLKIVTNRLSPVIARVCVPMLARGDECLTRSGLYGDVLSEAQLMEDRDGILSASVLIGNPFTDSPELCTQAIVVSHGDEEEAAASAGRLAQRMWDGRYRLTARLVPPERAVAIAARSTGPVLFTDAADATSSGASGDSNALIRALKEGRYGGRVLAHIVDAPAAAAAHRAGVGARIDITLGGTVDRVRFEPLQVVAEVESLSRGRAFLETMRLPVDAGPTAVLTFDNFTVLVISRPAFLFDRALYLSNGLQPAEFDLIVVKSPHTEFHMYEQWVSKSLNVDVPGSASADVARLGHQLCARPMFPLDVDARFTPRAGLYRRCAAPADQNQHAAVAANARA